MAPTNLAAWLPAKCAKPLKVGPAPYTSPGPGELVVKNHAIAINPVDWINQIMGFLMYLKYPLVAGNDVAGEVIEVGPDTRFSVGDRVVGQAMGTAPFSKKVSEGAFQQYTVLRQYVVAPIPDILPYEQACVLPLCLSTAAYGLFHKDALALDFPTVPAPVQPPIGSEGSKAVIVTGGASSVGCNAIQLAVSAGYRVYSTSSPKNFDYVNKLGATAVFDYNSETLVDDFLNVLQGQTLAGAYAIGSAEAVDVCEQVLRLHNNVSSKIVALAGIPFPPERISTYTGTALFVSYVLFFLVKKAVMYHFTGVWVGWITSKDLGDTDGVTGRIYRDFLPQALAKGQFKPAPDPLIVGKGLEYVQEAMDVHKNGVSCKKVVVSL
ncbi:hypothetical protein VPNG_05283 [Cytospora leucostoma]|uniref:Enoyl reductase (ER) domain-containing protein n=1 Tax=Cytospora leucostoma TaxID=1230097 RepID=A0A423X7L3_9PEZI|nr:hypothetical protein VPNG_05283 [Cytospora leucostoma]